MAKVLAAGVALAALVAGVIALGARSPEPREIRIVARDMTFYVDGGAEPNPTLRLRAGETVRLVLRNDDEGMNHDFAIPQWKTATARVASGESATVIIQVPGGRSSGGYRCRPHAEIMRGTIIVE